MALLESREAGLYCSGGDFYIDPWMPVARAVVTHAHSDHASPGSESYLTARAGAALLRARIGPDAAIQTLEYGEAVTMGGVRVSLHPAGHILGSSQIRMEQGGEVCVVSGDYKLAPDPTCAPYEPVRCHTFVTESTFGLPIFRWRPQEDVMTEIHAWWRANQDGGLVSLLYGYPLGKAQRLLAALDPEIGPLHVHESVERYSRLYRDQGVALPLPAEGDVSARSLVVGPPGLHNTAWARTFGPVSTAMVSGWMRIRGTRRRRSLDRGFVISDHADWSELQRAIEESGAEQVWVTHGYRGPLVQWLQEHGRSAVAVETHFEGGASELQ